MKTLFSFLNFIPSIDLTFHAECTASRVFHNFPTSQPQLGSIDFIRGMVITTSLQNFRVLRPRLQLPQLNSLRGGTKKILRFTSFDFERTPHPHFTSKLPLKGLKMTGRPFSAKIIFQNLTPIFRFWGIPGDPQFFFPKTCSRKI